MSLQHDTMHPPSLAQQLRSQGFAIDQLDADLTSLVRTTLSDAPRFFDAIDELPGFVIDALVRRQADGRALMFTGFRRPGEEYAQVYERPDLMQSFSIMAADRDRLPGRVWHFLSEHPFTGPLFAIRDAIVARATAALHELGALISDQARERAAMADLSRHTFIQVNSYRPNLYASRHLRAGQVPLAQRVYLQDPHEDGQFLTWAAASDWGLVGRSLDGSERALELIPPAPDRMLVMPSLPFTYYTGGPSCGGVPPFEHAVLREVDGRPIHDRTSLICFVNPDVTRALPVLVESNENANLSIPYLVNEAQWRFGLPRYESPEQVAVDRTTRACSMALVDHLYSGEHG